MPATRSGALTVALPSDLKTVVARANQTLDRLEEHLAALGNKR